jgi:hypothetical protein
MEASWLHLICNLVVVDVVSVCDDDPSTENSTENSALFLPLVLDS